MHTATTTSFQNVKCDVYVRKELCAAVALSVDYDIGVKIEGSFKGWVIEPIQLNCRSTSYTVISVCLATALQGRKQTLLAEFIVRCSTTVFLPIIGESQICHGTKVIGLTLLQALFSEASQAKQRMSRSWRRFSMLFAFTLQVNRTACVSMKMKCKFVALVRTQVKALGFKRN